MENGGLNDKFGGLSVSDVKDDNLSKVLKAVQVAEATIRKQVEENNKLRAELQKRDEELEYLGVNKARQTPTAFDLLSTLVLHQGPISKSEDFMRSSRVEDHYSVRSSNGDGLQTSDNAGFSQLSSPSAAHFSPRRYLNDREYDGRANVPAQGLTQVTESKGQSSLQNQIRENEEEIMLLRKHLTEYSVKEAQIRNEKYILEKRIAQMRMAFDQQQQDLIDAASKALSYRQDIIEENVRLAYALQDAQQERTTFVSSLLPLLTEYSLQPLVSDAQSIASNVKILFKHLQEKLLITEAKLKESQYQSVTGLELVPRPTYSPVNLANADGQIATDWESRGQHAFQAGGGVQYAEVDNMGRYSPFANR